MRKIETVEMGRVETDSGIRKFFLKLGGILAVALHPVFLFFYCFLFVHFTLDFQNPGGSAWLIAYVFGLSVLLPGMFSVLYSGDPYLNSRQKRPLVILFTLVCYATLTYIIMAIGGVFSLLKLVFHAIPGEEITQFNIYFHLLVYLMAGMGVLFAISFMYKISLHANGVGFLSALPFMYGLPWNVWHKIFLESALIIITVLFVLICLILLWQRVASGAHKLMEVVSGFCVGFGITILMEILL